MLLVSLQPSPELRTKCVGKSSGFVVARILVAVGAQILGQFRGCGHGHVYHEFKARDALRYGHDCGLAVRCVLRYTDLGAETERCYGPHYTSYRSCKTRISHLRELRENIHDSTYQPTRLLRHFSKPALSHLLTLVLVLQGHRKYRGQERL